MRLPLIVFRNPKQKQTKIRHFCNPKCRQSDRNDGIKLIRRHKVRNIVIISISQKNLCKKQFISVSRWFGGVVVYVKLSIRTITVKRTNKRKVK